jgi:hypothetical protein
MKAKLIPLTTGATGDICKSFSQSLSDIPGKHEIKEPINSSYIGH